MVAPTKKSFDAPDQRIEVPGVTAAAVEMADTTVSRNVFQPGAHCPQISQEGKPLCTAHHTGMVLSGRLRVEMQDGSPRSAPTRSSTSRPATTDGSSATSRW
jgi:hypothetical protein